MEVVEIKVDLLVENPFNVNRMSPGMKKKLTAWVMAREKTESAGTGGSSAVEALGYTGAGGKARDVKFKKRS